MNLIKATLLCLALLSITGCGQHARERELDSTNFDAATLREVEQETGVKLPAGAKGLNYYYKPPIDPIYIARIALPATAKDEMVKHLSALPQKLIGNSKNATGLLSWWHPETENIVVERISINDRGTYHHAILTEKDGAFTLYLYLSY
ncbi:MAG: hypothetical protein EOP85_01250 [Verrucomicrobiaceae bacterium]|nr:MAG: hypothetical protein EOP85_01250 [Verrucomicrobiaceae bacterium]